MNNFSMGNDMAMSAAVSVRCGAPTLFSIGLEVRTEMKKNTIEIIQEGCLGDTAAAVVITPEQAPLLCDWIIATANAMRGNDGQG